MESQPPPSSEVQPRIFIVCTDLIFSTKITGTAKALGRPFAVARSVEKLQTLLSGAAAGALVIVDLNAGGADPIAAVRAGHEHPSRPQVVAFLSHVQVELAAAARDAGAHRVLARSAFVEQLPILLSGQ